MPRIPPASNNESGDSAQARLSDQSLLPRRVYPMRILGMGLGSLCIGTVLVENQAPLASWIWLAFTALVWPHLAYAMARRSGDPYRVELRNLMFDSTLAGSWVPLLAFNLLPSALLLTLATVDKINTGVRGLWVRSLPGMLGAVVVVGALTGFDLQPHSSTPVVLACLPMLVLHTTIVALGGYRLVRKVQQQNRLLDELSRVDVLTGLASRRHWQEQAELMLRERHLGGAPVSLLMIDVDRFKEINDAHGHAVGDDVLRSVAALIRHHIGAGDVAGRLGGDELAVALRGDAGRAEAIAGRMLESARGLRLPHVPDLRCSLSIGFAEAGDADLGLREWLESADAALYRAKSNGRDRIAGRVARDGSAGRAHGALLRPGAAL